MMNLDVLIPGHGVADAFGSSWPIVILGIIALTVVGVALLMRDLKKKNKEKEDEE